MLQFKDFGHGADRAQPIDTVPQAVQPAFQRLPINLSPEEIRALVRDILG